MTSIKLIVTGASAQAEVDGLLTSGMVGIPVTIVCDGAWDGLTKSMVCRGGSVIRTILDVGDAATVPHECMIANTTLQIGVEGRNADGTLVIPTVWARCGLICSGANADADPSTDPTLPVWAQIQAMIGNLDDLETEAKNNLVDAVNEAMTKGGGIGIDTSLTVSGKAADAAVVGEKFREHSEEIANLPSGGSGLTTAQVNALDGMFKVTAFSTDPVSAYAAFKEAFGIKESESEGVPATAIVLDKTALSFADITTQTITANVTPSNSTDPVVWSTSDPAIATVSGGVVTPVADGSCTITATAGSVSASCEVTVSISAAPPASGVEWEIGGINPLGTLNTNTARLRTTGLIPREYDSVSANDGYELIVCCFNKDGTNPNGQVYFNPNDNTVGSTGVYSSGPIDLAGIKAGTIGFSNVYSWFKILLRRTDGANMAVEEGENGVVFA